MRASVVTSAPVSSHVFFDEIDHARGVKPQFPAAEKLTKPFLLGSVSAAIFIGLTLVKDHINDCILVDHTR